MLVCYSCNILGVWTMSLKSVWRFCIFRPYKHWREFVRAKWPRLAIFCILYLQLSRILFFFPYNPGYRKRAFCCSGSGYCTVFCSLGRSSLRLFSIPILCSSLNIFLFRGLITFSGVYLSKSSFRNPVESNVGLSSLT